MLKIPVWSAALLTFCLSAAAYADASLKNDRYELTLQTDRSVQVRVEDLPAQIIRGEFSVMYSEKNPGYHANHENYRLAPRTAVRWPNYSEPIDELNRWLDTPDVRIATGGHVTVSEDAKGARTWTYKDDAGKITRKFSGVYALGTINPFFVGKQTQFTPSSAKVSGDSIVWQYGSQSAAKLTAQITLPKGEGDPIITWKMQTRTDGYYSVIFTGAPSEPASTDLSVPQECLGRMNRQFNFVVCEGDLKLPRAHITTPELNSALVIDAKESPFRLVDRANSRFGLMVQRVDGQLRPMALAPIMGGPESKMKSGEERTFTLHYVLRPGDWKETYRYIARSLYGFRDMRDNTGPGSLIGTIERIVDYIVDRNGHNYAMWHAEQKYFDYWTDKSGVFKPFSPLFGLSAAVVTDDEVFYRTRALPAIEFALSRKSNIFSPYELRNNGMISNPNRDLGAPYLNAIQLISAGRFFQNHDAVFGHYAEAAGFGKSSFVDALAKYRLSGKKEDLDAAIKIADAALKRAGGSFMDWLEMYDETHDARYVKAAQEAAYHDTARLNLFPAIPDKKITMDVGGKTPIHEHSYGRARVWGYPQPEPFPSPEQTVPAWRPALTGIESDAYRAGFWMNMHGQFMRVAALASDDFLRDIGRWGVVGRFGTYAGDNRSKLSLVVEQPDALEHPIWELNFSTVNPGHAWEFVGEMLDFLISDAFHRSGGQIDFPSESMNGASFQVRTYGARPGHFYDEHAVRLWLPRKLFKIDNKQIDYLAGYGNGKVYFALWNQSFADEDATIVINPDLVDCSAVKSIKVWKQNKPDASIPLGSGATLHLKVPAKGIIAVALEGAIAKTRLQSKMFDPAAIRLSDNSLVESTAPFGKVHAMLLSMGKGLTSAFIYTEALPENVIEAKLKYRQGEGEWHELSDAIFPYEFSPVFDEGKGDMQCVFQVENAQQQIQKSEVITLKP